MATYQELFDLRTNQDLINRTAVALTIAAKNKIDAVPVPTLNEQKWAASVLADPMEHAPRALRYVLAVNQAATVPQISGASDAQLQSNVNSAVDSLVAAHNA